MKIVSMLILTGLFVCGSLSGQEAKQPTSPAASPKPTGASQTEVNSDYKIGAQDVVRVDVWKEPDISRTIPVRPDGKISLPLLNDVQATGLTATQLSAAIHDGLTKYLTNPQVTVTVTEINSRRVYVTGEVTRPGALALLPNMTVLQALTSVGGFTQFAKIKNIYVLRVEEGKQVQHPFNYKEVVKGKKPEDNALLQPGDVVVVP